MQEFGSVPGNSQNVSCQKVSVFISKALSRIPSSFVVATDSISLTQPSFLCLGVLFQFHSVSLVESFMKYNQVHKPFEACYNKSFHFLLPICKVNDL